MLNNNFLKHKKLTAKTLQKWYRTKLSLDIQIPPEVLCLRYLFGVQRPNLSFGGPGCLGYILLSPFQTDIRSFPPGIYTGFAIITWLLTPKKTKRNPTSLKGQTLPDFFPCKQGSCGGKPWWIFCVAYHLVDKSSFGPWAHHHESHHWSCLSPWDWRKQPGQRVN